MNIIEIDYPAVVINPQTGEVLSESQQAYLGSKNTKFLETGTYAFSSLNKGMERIQELENEGYMLYLYELKKRYSPTRSLNDFKWFFRMAKWKPEPVLEQIPQA